MNRQYYQLALMALTALLMGVMMISGCYLAKRAVSDAFTPPVVQDAASAVNENMHFIDDASAKIEANKGVVDELLNYIK